jgi:uncharacterized protein DUF4340
VVEAALTQASPQRPAAPLRTRGALLLAAPLAAAVLVLLLITLLISGHWPELRSVVAFTPKGVIGAAPSEVTRIEIRTGQESVAVRREQNAWTIEGAAQPVPAELAAHLDTALRFLHVSEPVRDIQASELNAASFAAFGLDPPASVVTLEMDRGSAATVNFGLLNPAGTSQYVRLAGAATVHLMPRHVGTEWQVAAGMAQRLQAPTGPAVASRGTSLLLPVSLAQVWAVEIVFAGKLTRFERDGAGDWFRHVGQHSHANNAGGHVADPAQARVIGAALDAFDQAAVETRVARGADERELQRFGLTLPPVIVLLYARDSSAALARLELGAAADRLDRYARLVPDGDVVTVAEFQAARLTELLKAVGAGS